MTVMFPPISEEGASTIRIRFRYAIAISRTPSKNISFSTKLTKERRDDVLCAAAAVSIAALATVNVSGEAVRVIALYDITSLSIFKYPVAGQSIVLVPDEMGIEVTESLILAFIVKSEGNGVG
tara:strand:- start:11037 stop:11405 length:369 start_codon:yes stop_codon:yes gene_type:complete